MLLAAMILLAGGAVACAVGLLQYQAATLQADHYIGTTTDKAAFTHTTLVAARIWIWTGIIALVGGLTALVTAFRRRRAGQAPNDAGAANR